MTYLGIGVAFVLVSFLALNTVTSALALLLWPVLRSRLRGAGAIFRLRMLPTGASVAGIVLLVLPAFLLFEPLETHERVGVKLVPVALLAGLLIGAGLRRGLRAWLATRRLLCGWLDGAEKLEDADARVPVHRIRGDLPLAALVGVARPRVLLSDRLLEVLSPDEKRAVLRHEMEHLAARDNVKRIALALSPDWISLFPAGREMDRAWAAAAEDEADARAAGTDPARALDLASSLVKAARLMPAGGGALLPTSSFCDPATVSRRVMRLLEDRPALRGTARLGGWRLGWLALFAGAFLVARPALELVYSLAEVAVRSLQ